MSRGRRALRYPSESDMPEGMRRLLGKKGGAGAGAGVRTAPAPAPEPPSAPAKLARGRTQHVPGEMNKTEAAYANELERRRLLVGDVLWWRFESVKLRLAKSTFLTLDFFVQRGDGTLEAHEVKGHWEDDARVKIKVAAALFPFRFLAVRKDGGTWRVEEIRP